MATAAPYRDPRTAYGRRIPVGEATELAGIPPEMQPPRAAAPAAAPGGIAEPPPQRLMQRVAGAAGPIAKAAGIGALPAIGALALRSGADNGSSATPPTPVGLGDIPRGIPGGIASPPAERPPFFAQSETGRNIANAAMAIPGASGIARGIAALPRIAAQIPTTAGKVAQAAPVAADMVRGTVMADAAMGNVAAPAAVPPPGARSLPPGVRLSTAGAGRGSVNPPRADPNAQLPTTEAQDARRLRTDGSNVTIGTVPSYGAEAQAIDARVRDINASMAQTQRALDAYGPGPQGGGMTGIGGGTLSSANREAFDATPSGSILPAQGQSVRQFQDLRAAERESIRNRMLTERGQDMTLAGQQAAAGAQRGIADLQAGTQRAVAKMAADSRTTAAETAANARAAAAELAARRFIPVAGGQQVLEIGGQPTTVTQPSRVFDSTRGIYVDPPAPQGGKPGVTPRAEYEKMPKGAKYVGPDGQTYVKG